MFTARFWLLAVERAVKSSAQALLLLWGGDAAFDVWDADWRMAAGVAAGAAVLSLLTSVVSTSTGDPSSPSLVPADR